MTRKIIAYVSAAILFVTLAFVAYTQNAPPKLTLKQVKPSLFEIEGDGGNVAVYITGNGVILIDDKFEQDHDAIVDAVTAVTTQPIRYVINTHYHADHSGGNGRMATMNLQIISTAQSRINIVKKVQTNAPPNVVPASVVFTDQTSVFLGGKEVRAKFFGRGHTNGDAFIYFPALRTVHTGDNMAGTSPLVDYPGGGSVVEWTNTLDKVMKEWDFDTVIPGHGNVTDKAGLQTYRDNVVKLRDQVSSMVKGGKSQADVASFMEKEYMWGPNSLQQQWSVPGFMTELK
jgi:glyoxylase-like metal-dependent hydrolase (beta-lactamase superfamily II)